jgi:anaerobic selenocysteine-containing dehydrogenase
LYRYQPDPGTDRYPLALISPASDRTISSTLGELPRTDVKLTMNPADAAARGLADNDLVRVFNELGEVHCTLAVSASVRSGLVSLPKGVLAAEHAQRRERHCPGSGNVDRILAAAPALTTHASKWRRSRRPDSRSASTIRN